MMQAIKVLAVVFITFLVIDIIQGLYLENGNQFRLGRRTTRGPQSRSSADESDTFHSVMGKNRCFFFKQCRVKLSAYNFFLHLGPNCLLH